MKKLIFMALVLLGSGAYAQSLRANVLICGNGSLMFQADIEKKWLSVGNQSSYKIMWEDEIINVNYLPGFETIPPRTKLTIELKKLGKIQGFIIDRLITDKNGTYKIVTGVYYNGIKSGNENYDLGKCHLVFEQKDLPARNFFNPFEEGATGTIILTGSNEVGDGTIIKMEAPGLITYSYGKTLQGRNMPVKCVLE